MFTIAQAVLTPDTGLEQFAKAALDAFTGHNYRYLAALLVLAAVWGLTKLLEARVPFFGTAGAKALLAMLLGVLGGVATCFMANTAPSFNTVLAGIGIGWTASGGWSQAKAIFELFAKKPAPPAP